MITQEQLAQAILDLGNRLEASQEKTDEQMKETDERMKETQATLKKVTKLVGNISNNQGDITEEYFINSLEECLRVGNIDFDYLIPNFIAKSGHSILAEYDILLINGKSVAIVEVKYKAHLNDLDKLPKKIEQLKNLPQYKNYKVYVGLATFYATHELIKKAKELGYFILQRQGDIVVTHADNLKAA